jgi:inosose dehydratase
LARFRIGNAPVSWGVEELPDWGPQLDFHQVLAEMALAGYEGTELGPWGYLPQDERRLARLIDRYGLTLASAFCPLSLHLPTLPDQELAELRREAHLLRALGADILILADSGSPHRYQVAGRADADAGEDALDDAGFRRLREHVARVADLADSLGMRLAFHPHVGTYVESAREIDAFLDAVQGLDVRLCVDTGHLAYAGVDPADVVERHSARVAFCHFKDVDKAVLEASRRRGLDFNATVRAGVFVPPGAGAVDFPRIVASLRRANFDGWLVVEQDRVLDDPDQPLADAFSAREYLRALVGR